MFGRRLCLMILFFFGLNLSVLAAAPIVTAISPSAGSTSGGTAVSITGSGFTGAAAVRFGSSPALSFVVNSDNLITALTPVNVPGAIDVTVTALTGTSVMTVADRYTYQGAWFAYVSNQGTGQVTPIAVPSNVDGTSFTLAGTAVDIAITPDGSRAYISKNSLNCVDVLDLSTNTVLTTIPVGPSPLGVAIAPDGQKVYVATSGSSSISVIEVSSNTVVDAIGLEQTPFGVAITPDGTTVYVTTSNGKKGTVIAIDTATHVAGMPIQISAHLAFLAISPDGQKAYIGRQDSGSLFVYDIPSNNVTKTISFASESVVPYRIAITPDGTKGYAVNLNGTENNIYPLDLINNTSGAPISVGMAPFGVAITPDGDTAYVANSGSNDLTSIDVATNTAGVSIPLTSGSSIIAITPDQAPLASFIATVVAAGGATVFDASASTSPVGIISIYDWDFGDGQTSVTSSPVTSHTYVNPGVYNAALVVTNSIGTSTEQVFTGMTMLRNGGSSAISIQAINVADPSILIEPMPPAKFEGRVIKDELPTQTDYIHQLVWLPSPDRTIVEYLIRRNGHVIARISKQGPFVYNDDNRKKWKKDLYAITAVNADGVESPSLTLTLPHKFYAETSS